MLTKPLGRRYISLTKLQIHRAISKCLSNFSAQLLHGAADLFGDDYSAQVVYAPDYAGRFHGFSSCLYFFSQELVSAVSFCLCAAQKLAHLNRTCFLLPSLSKFLLSASSVGMMDSSGGMSCTPQTMPPMMLMQAVSKPSTNSMEITVAGSIRGPLSAMPSRNI